MEQKTYQYLLKPLEDAFGKSYTSSQLGQFSEDCGHYSPETMQQAVRQLRRECDYLPNLKKILAALREFDGNGTKVSSQAMRKKQEEQEKRWHEAHRRAETWLQNSDLSRQSQAEGWYSIGALGGLKSWVHRLCQAQAVEESGLNAELCPEHLVFPRDPEGARNRRHQVVGILRSGEILVPMWLIDAWRPIGVARKQRDESMRGSFLASNPTQRENNSGVLHKMPTEAQA